jgi:hypothetical protein
VLSVHDNEIISYKVNLKNKVISIKTVFENGQDITVMFSDVLAHMFESHLYGSIILEIEKSKLGQFFEENMEMLEQQKAYCWPTYHQDVKELEEILIKEQYSYYIISASYGLSGWVLAKKIELLNSY